MLATAVFAGAGGMAVRCHADVGAGYGNFDIVLAREGDGEGAGGRRRRRRRRMGGRERERDKERERARDSRWCEDHFACILSSNPTHARILVIRSAHTCWMLTGCLQSDGMTNSPLQPRRLLLPGSGVPRRRRRCRRRRRDDADRIGGRAQGGAA